MNSEVKKKLEEISLKFHKWDCIHLPKCSHDAMKPGCNNTPPYPESTFMAGATAAWELFSQPSEDDEKVADYYTEAFFQATKKDQPCYADEITKAFLAGRRGLRESVQKAVREEQDRIIKEASKLTCYGAKIVVTELAQILNPKENDI